MSSAEPESSAEEAVEIKDSPQRIRIVYLASFSIACILFFLAVCLLFSVETTLTWVGAIMFIVGSKGFIFCNLLDLFIFSKANVSRYMAVIDFISSVAFLVASVGFLPPVWDSSADYAIWGFIVGSALSIITRTISIFRLLTVSSVDFKDGATHFVMEFLLKLSYWAFLVITIVFNFNQHDPDMFRTSLYVYFAACLVMLVAVIIAHYRFWILDK